MLAALIQERHDYVDTACLSACCRNDTFQILIMIIRGHMVYHAAQRIRLAVVADIHDQIQIIAAHRRLISPFASPEPNLGVFAPMM